MEVKFGIHLDIKFIRIGEDVDAFFHLSIQAFLKGSFNFNLKACVVLDFLWMEIIEMSCKSIGRCLVLDGGFVTLESVVS